MCAYPLYGDCNLLQWLRRTETLSGAVHATGVLSSDSIPCAQLVHLTDTPCPISVLKPSTPAPRRRRNRVIIENLYPVSKPEAEVHARALLDLVATECPQFAGRYVPQKDLARTYEELCQRERWTPRHWTSIGRELAKITDRRKAKRQGVRFPAYRIPRIACSR